MQGQMYFADKMAQTLGPSQDDKTNEGEIFSFGFITEQKKNNQIGQNEKEQITSMSPVYESGSILMEEVIDHIWSNDGSGLFDFDTLTFAGIQNKTHVLQFSVYSKDAPTERAFYVNTFVQQTIANICKLTQSNTPIIRVDTKFVTDTNIENRKRMNWK